MSAATLRAPARWHRAARAEAGALLRTRWVPVVLLLIAVLTMGSLGTESGGPFGQMVELTVLMFFFPLLLWRGRAVRGSLDGAMPVGTTAYELIRVGVGAAAALAVLCIATRAYAPVFIPNSMPGELAGFARGYTAALILHGLAVYLAASAILLRAPRPGRVLLAVFFVGSVLLLLLGIGMETTTREVRFAPDGTATAMAGSSLTVGKALLQLVLAAAAVGVSVWIGGREGGLSLPWRRAGGTAPATVRTMTVPRAALAVPRRPASLRVVAMRQLVIQAPRMAWPLLVAALLGLWYVAGGMGLWGMTDQGALYVGGFFLLWLVSYLWPLLVWMDERGGRPWDEAQPVDAFRRRLLHWVAGLAWLEACVGVLLIGHVIGAAAGGTLASAAWLPAWVLPGVPLAVMAVYCVGTVPAVLAAHPIRGSILALLVIGPALQLEMSTILGEPTPLSLARLLAPVQASDNHEWSIRAALAWIPVFAALAVLALLRRTARDRGATSLPTR